MVGITIDAVTKRFGDVRAVDDVTLQIEEGELFFLLGPSGCGKTTLLRMIAGFYYPDGGRILFDGRDVSDVPPHERNTGMVFQNYALWPHMSVRQNLAFGLEMHGVPSAERTDRVSRALEAVQMTEYADRSPNQLSGGQQQRVALGRALVLEPDVVLMDEPLSNLDAKLRLEMRERIKRIHGELGLTMVYVTHDQAEALSMADRMAVMRRGRLGQVGAPRDLHHRPDSAFIAEFIGETNLVGGRVTGVGDRVDVETAAGPVASSEFYEGIAVGDDVICSLRPEQLDILSEGDSRPNEWTGIVVQAFFLGNQEQYLVDLPDGTTLKVVEHDARHARVHVGDTTSVGFAYDDVVVLRGDSR